ncbi:MAG: TerC family protein [Planctomycetes bacterium]|nr:TerC family protein [Planctomycetota bacterium]
MFDWLSSVSWPAVGQIILFDVLLGGDNAVLIALACRKLPPRQRRLGILWGALGAIVMRVLLVTVAIGMLEQPALSLIGGVLLLWIGVKLILPDDGKEHQVDGSENLLGAIKTIIVADLVMSFDNVLSIATTAERLAPPEQRTALVAFGLAVSVPLIIGGSRLVLWLLDRLPIVIWLGAALLGWIAGETIVTDPLLLGKDADHSWRLGAGLSCAAVVVVFGRILGRRAKPDDADAEGL